MYILVRIEEDRACNWLLDVDRDDGDCVGFQGLLMQEDHAIHARNDNICHCVLAFDVVHFVERKKAIHDVSRRDGRELC